MPMTPCWCSTSPPVCCRCPADPQGWCDIRLPLIVDWPHRPRSKVDHAFGKPSHTRWRPHPDPSGYPGTTRLSLMPVSGRSHQLRVHLMAIGHPILGDELYASPERASMSARLLLHAHQLGFAHPFTGEPLIFKSIVPF